MLMLSKMKEQGTSVASDRRNILLHIRRVLIKKKLFPNKIL